MYFKCNLEEEIVSNSGSFNKPYFKYEGTSLEAAFFIDKFSYIEKERKVIIDGWFFGDELYINNVEAGDVVFNRVSRVDVSEAFKKESSNLGFNSHIYLGNDLSLSISFCEMNIDITLDSLSINKISSLKKFSINNEKLLIVGGAPTVKENISDVQLADKDVWALNDSVFYLEKKNINVDVLLVSDVRFVEKSFDMIKSIKCKNVIIADYIDPNSKCFIDKEIYPVLIKGRDGVSIRKGEAFHGCTVANFSLQVARFLNYKEIKTLGVLLHFPIKYQRLDGSSTMPEFVLDHQISNVKKTLLSLRKSGVSVKAIEKNSNINFL